MTRGLAQVAAAGGGGVSGRAGAVEARHSPANWRLSAADLALPGQHAAMQVTGAAPDGAVAPAPKGRRRALGDGTPGVLRDHAARGTARPSAPQGGYTAILGGTFTFGHGLALPYPTLLEAALGQPVLNLGARNAGIDAALRDEGVLRLGAGAARVVVQITGAQALSNPFYRVHPRRNDRLIGPTEALRRLYPEVDFTPFAFTGHLLAALSARDGDPGPDATESRFAQVVAALRTTWVARMQVLLRALGPGRATLLWVGAPPAGLVPGTPAARHTAPPRWPVPEPAFITAGMLTPLRPLAARLVVVPPGHAARLPGAQSQVHRRVADTLAPVLRG